MKIKFRWPLYYPKPSQLTAMRSALNSAKSMVKHDEAGNARGLACPGCHVEDIIKLVLEGK